MRGKDRNRRKARRLRAEHIKLGGRDRGSEGTTERVQWEQIPAKDYCASFCL